MTLSKERGPSRAFQSIKDEARQARRARSKSDRRSFVCFDCRVTPVTSAGEQCPDCVDATQRDAEEEREFLRSRGA